MIKNIIKILLLLLNITNIIFGLYIFINNLNIERGTHIYTISILCIINSFITIVCLQDYIIIYIFKILSCIILIVYFFIIYSKLNTNLIEEYKNDNKIIWKYYNSQIGVLFINLILEIIYCIIA